MQRPTTDSPRAPRTVSTVPLIEKLEDRRLLASINVLDFGVRPDDGQDDTAGLRAAINASGAGDSINFAPGHYDFGDTVELASNREYKGWGEAVLERHGDGYLFQNDQANYNITVTDLIFEARGINVSPNSTGQSILIRGCTFQNITGSWPAGDAIYAPTGLRDSKITRTKFLNIEGDNGVYGFNTFDNVEISHNWFNGVWEGIHLAYGSGKDLRILNNTGWNWTRMPLELQGENAQNTQVIGNRFYDWVNPYHGSFAMSIMNYGEGTIIRNNVVSGPSDAPVGIEVGGRNGIVEGNRITGFREGMHLVGSTGTQVFNNDFNNQSLVAIWRTGIDEAFNLRIYNNRINNTPWAFQFSGGRHDGSIVENNTLTNIDKGIVGDTPGVSFNNNVFNNVKEIRS